MKKHAEIKRILTEDLGFATLDAYKEWIERVRPTLTPTPAMIEKLSPDSIDCRDFWRVCEEVFGHDPVCNVAIAPTVGKLPHAIEAHMDANRMNLRLAKSRGVTSFLEENASERVKTLEIGAGFGSLKHFIETHTNHVYTGVDVFPRIPGIVEATAEGCIPEDLVEAERGLYGYVVSSNVFQHLSARQRTRYYADAASLLHLGGLFIFNLYVDTGKRGTYLRDAKGNAWCDHYGQYTLIPKSDIYAELATSFDVLYVTQRYDGLFNFVCRKSR